MSIKRTLLLIGIVALICSGTAIFVIRMHVRSNLDVVAVNDIVQSLADKWDQLNEISQTNLPGLQYNIDYVVIDNNGEFITATRNDLNNEINLAISNQDTIVDIIGNNELLGKLIINNDSSKRFEQYRNELLVFVICLIFTLAILCLLFTIYFDRVLFKPFRKLQSFARLVAEGRLDVPLEMDKDNMFGAFTESFDIMREEINRARLNEKKANQAKKELVASLSHDIKTPVASIMAVSDLIYAMSYDDKLKKQIEIIISKADQINNLITNLFNSTLEELNELKVSITEMSSRRLYDLIKNADYNNKVTISKINECLIKADELRLSQVIDNILSNSYKYADTSIEVSTKLIGKYLELAFKDFGSGVPEDEKPLIFNKFYRATNSGDINGTGLGLYISKYIMNKMSGEIVCENVEDGFIVKLMLQLV